MTATLPFNLSYARERGHAFIVVNCDGYTLGVGATAEAARREYVDMQGTPGDRFSAERQLSCGDATAHAVADEIAMIEAKEE